MYEIGRFAVIGEAEPEPVGYLPIRLLPRNHIIGFPWWSASTQAVLTAMPDVIKPGDRVLDFGTGASAILAIAAARLGATVTATEIHTELAALAREQLAANDVSAEVYEAIDGGDFDVVLANVGDAELVGRLSNIAPHGIGTDKDGALISW